VRATELPRKLTGSRGGAALSVTADVESALPVLATPASVGDGAREFLPQAARSPTMMSERTSDLDAT
jgi:hypothetical protein